MADQAAQDEAVRLAAELIRIDTTNRGGGDARERPAAEYVAAELAEAGLDPVLLERTPGRANVVARIEGTDPAQPALLLHGHLDVVPAEPADWSVHPFSGEVRDGVLWGRGAVDMKNAVAVLVAVARGLARTGRRPARDVVLAFTADEEDSAADGAAFLAGRHAGLFDGCTAGLGESGAFTFHAAPSLRLYPVGAAERGTAWLKLTARGTAGHGSRPNSRNAVTALAGAVTRIGEHTWPARLIPTVRAALVAMADALGLDAASAERDPDGLLARLGPASVLVAPVLRNSANPTMLQAGYKVNVIPGEAVGYVDGRMLPGYEAEFEAVMDELTGPDVGWEYTHREGSAGGAAGRPADGRDDERAAGRRSAVTYRALLHGERHRCQALLPPRHRGLRIHPARAAARVRLPRDVPRRGRAHPGDRAALRRAGDGPTTDDGELIR